MYYPHEQLACQTYHCQPMSTEPAFVDDYLAALLAQASQLISAEFHEVVRAHGISVPEWRVLASLAGGEPISIHRCGHGGQADRPGA